MVRIVIENHHLHAAGEQHAAGNLPVAAKAGNNYPRLLFVNFIRLALLAAGGFLQTGQQHQQDWRGSHR